MGETAGIITVLLLNWRRHENIGAVLDCLDKQSVRPRIVLWDNGYGEHSEIKVRGAAGELRFLHEDPRVDLAVYPSRNMGCLPRWWLASVAETEFVCSLDDDLLLADERVLEDAIAAQRALCPDGIVGFFGWRREGSKPYKAARHINGRPKRDEPVDLIKGRFMLFPRGLLERVPTAIPGIDSGEDDLYVSLCISRGRPGHHVVPQALAGRFRNLGKEDGRSRALRPGHYEHRDELISKLIAYWQGKRQ